MSSSWIHTLEPRMLCPVVLSLPRKDRGHCPLHRGWGQSALPCEPGMAVHGESADQGSRAEDPPAGQGPCRGPHSIPEQLCFPREGCSLRLTSYWEGNRLPRCELLCGQAHEAKELWKTSSWQQGGAKALSPQLMRNCILSELGNRSPHPGRVQQKGQLAASLRRCLSQRQPT